MINHSQKNFLKMNRLSIIKYTAVLGFVLSFTACKTPQLTQKDEKMTLPEEYSNFQKDSLNSAKLNWKDYFADPYLQALIDTALVNNQELNIILQEIEISKNEVRARKGEYLPSAGLKAGAGVDKVSRYTNIGAMEANTEILHGKEMPEPLQDYMVGAYATWEIDVWKKLRNAKKAAVNRYLASVEGKNFMVTNLIAEIANSYYELLALDCQLEIVKENIKIQSEVLEIVKLLKESARTNELAVKRFEAQVLKTKGMKFEIQQKITETENRINFLTGRFPQKVERNPENFHHLVPPMVFSGLPSHILQNRADIRQAELELAACKLDVKSAKARFYPALGISAGIGYQAFNPDYLTKPHALMYSVTGDLIAPLINRNAIKADYYRANSKQLQAVYEYQKTILNAYIEVVNSLSKIKNLDSSFKLKEAEVDAMVQSVEISNNLFKSTRADYMEVLLTQREALEAKFELIEIKMKQLNETVNTYRALGGGWQ